MSNKTGLGALCNICNDFRLFKYVEMTDEEKKISGRKHKKLLPDGWQIITTDDIKIYCPKCLRIMKLNKIINDGC